MLENIFFNLKIILFAMLFFGAILLFLDWSCAPTTTENNNKKSIDFNKIIDIFIKIFLFSFLVIFTLILDFLSLGLRKGNNKSNTEKLFNDIFK